MNLRMWLRTGVAALAAVATVTVGGVAAAAAAPGYGRVDLQRDLDAITATGVPGVLAEVRSGTRQFSGTSGVADLDTRAPVRPDGYFRMGSNTKTFISVVLLQLVGERRLSLDDPVDHWLPGLVHGNGNDGTRITVRELLQHTSGLHNYSDDLQERITSIEAYRELEFHQFSRTDLVDIALASQPDFAPGTGWNYSNTNYVLLGMIIEKVTGHTWADEVTRRIVKPLGLRHTYAPGDRTDLPAPHATGYLFFDPRTHIDTTAQNMSWTDAAGALITTADDLTRFWTALGRGVLLRPAQQRAMLATVAAPVSPVPGSRYGLGISFVPLSCGGGYWTHEGDVPGYNTLSGVSEDGRTTVVVSLDSNVDDPQLNAEYGLIDHAMCAR